jgi:hypothetical protein
MRAAALLCLVACYAPVREDSCVAQCSAGAQQCPAGYSCNHGYCSQGPQCASDGGVAADGSIFPRDDASPFTDCTHLVLPSVAPTNTDPLSGVGVYGFSYSANLAADPYAVLLRNSTIEGTSAPLGTNYTPLYSKTGLNALDVAGPHLSHDGRELWFRVDRPTGSNIEYAPRDGATWSSLQPARFLNGGTDVLIAINDVPTSPTQTTPRRMLMVRQGERMFAEYTEVTPTLWQRLTIYSATDIDALYGDDAILTADGLGLVYRNTGNKAFFVRRDTLDAPFEQPTQLPGPAFELVLPFVTADCRHLFYSDAENLNLHHISY